MPSTETRPEIAEPPPAQTEPPGAGERLIFLPGDFARFAPRTALDMVKQVPGFTINDPVETNASDNTAVRGLGQASGNVLLNGERFTSKSDTISSQLARIDADDVIRIELVEGAALDLPGLSGQVANVVALNSGGISGQFEWWSEFRGKQGPNTLTGLIASITGSSGPVSYVLAFDSDPFNGGASGPNLVTFGDGRVEHRFNTIAPKESRPKLSGSIRVDGASGWVANLNGSYVWERFEVGETEYWPLSPGDSEFASEILSVDSPEDIYEIGGDFTFALGPGQLKLIGQMSRIDDEFAQQGIISMPGGVPATGTRFIKAAVSSEKILRAEYGWRMLGGDWQLSGEAAYNKLDNVAGLFVLSPEGEFEQVPFPAGTGGVVEDRYESLLFHGRPLGGNLTLQATVGAEYSKIAQTGALAESRTFLRPKGSIGLAWAPGSGLDISLQLRREVGQLDFEDFLAQVDIGDDNTDGGNNDLRPEQKWAAELAVAKNFGAWGSATVTLFENRITDYVTIVPLPGGGESTGNVASARERGARFVGTLRLDPVGVNGAKVDVEAYHQSSTLTDPTTGLDRQFDLYEPSEIDIKLRHDIPATDWAWSLRFRSSSHRPYYRVGEFGLDYNNGTDLNFSVEHKNIFGLTGTFIIENLLDSDIVLDRTVYQGPRHISPILFSESRRRKKGQVITLKLKGGF